MFPFYTPWKRQQTSDVFKGYRKGTFAWNGLSNERKLPYTHILYWSVVSYGAT